MKNTPDQTQATPLRRSFSRTAPWYIKVARTSALTLACLAAIPHALENLPGEPIPEVQAAPLRAFFQQAANPDEARIHSSKAADIYLAILGAEAAAFGTVILMRQSLKDRLETENSYIQYILAHEIGHLHQHQKSASLAYLQTAWERAGSLGAGQYLYEYSLLEGKSFADYGIEQQASIIADYYYISQGQEPLCLTDEIGGAARDALYEKVLAGFLRDRGVAEPTPALPEI